MAGLLAGSGKAGAGEGVRDEPDGEPGAGAERVVGWKVDECDNVGQAWTAPSDRREAAK